MSLIYFFTTFLNYFFLYYLNSTLVILKQPVAKLPEKRIAFNIIEHYILIICNTLVNQTAVKNRMKAN